MFAVFLLICLCLCVMYVLLCFLNHQPAQGLQMKISLYGTFTWCIQVLMFINVHCSFLK
uniref:Uncharacterized protein n=1 Tax=Anguilla anguilla TaxID=7936 RepID=A0A0E9XPA4_ANGAN